MSNSDFQLAPDPFNQLAKTVVDPEEVRARLLQLHPDLTPELLARAILKGLGARNDTTKASAPTAAGGKQWFDTLEELRNLLLEKRWNPHDQRNCPFAIAPDRSISIVVMTGNAETGRQGLEDPSTAADKGAVAENYVSANRQQVLFNQAQEQQGTQVWALLYHYDKNLKEVRYELSLPTDFSKKKITGWGERLILGSIPNSPTDFTIREDVPNAPATVDVKPKTGT
ncbi:hypothetical protein [Comamonas squillarum]|uniref:Uncharacterized protein n=1 Tax=Comamonas squillarum TaxID=2977320 RepID=A0ABY5ZZB3_9BURK|nr:hypothetical protein [Comamonas sp. PR12]UXC17341.1 hypothetical protein N4T19_16735 [Comamonas sp. PR12]